MQLVDNVEELKEDWREAAVLVGAAEAAPVVEPVTKGQPLLLHQHAESLHMSYLHVFNHYQKCFQKFCQD